MSETDKLRKVLEKIAEVAASAANGHGYSGTDSVDKEVRLCTPRSLPKRLLLAAAKTAMQINPVNAPSRNVPLGAALDISDPLQIAVMTAKYWGPIRRQLTVSFMETTSADLRQRIVSHMNAWSTAEGISFAETSGAGQVRISRGPGGYWSYLGTDILHIPQDHQTMNLQDFTMSTPESEYHRVVRHETGHTLGFPHEHMRKELVARISPQKAYVYFLQNYGWSKTMVDQQVPTPLDDASIMGTPPDQTSIMCYQLPGSITLDGQPIIGGTDINQTDYTFAAQIYPKAGDASVTADEDWANEFATA